MPRPSVIPQILERLEKYLESSELTFRGQSAGAKHPTLPSTGDGKVNVRAVAQAIGLKTTQEKYLYERPELSQIINLVAVGQGLLPIGSRLEVGAGDKAINERLAQQALASKVLAQAAVEARAIHEELLEQLRLSSIQVQQLQADNLRLREQLKAIHQGIFLDLKT